MKTMSKVKKMIILSDIHLPNHDDRALSLVEKYLKDNRFDYYVLLGDFLDFDYLSKFDKDNLRKLEGKRILDDYKIANELLDRHQRLIRIHNKNCQFFYLLGNHDLRIEKLIDKNPTLEGLIELEAGLKIKERGFKILDSFGKHELLNIGKLFLMHGNYIGKHNAHKMVEDYDCSVVYGHTHTHQTFCKSRFDKRDLKIAQSIGTLQKFDPDYMGKRPSAWVQSFGVVYFNQSGNFNLYPVIINNGEFISPEGKIYK